MQSKDQVKKPRGRISDAAVQERTGRVWQEWFTILDQAGAKEMSHKEIAHYLAIKRGVSGWWSQMVANTYEQERGMREKHQMPQGYQISVSRTLEVPVSTLYRSWSDDRIRQRWLSGECITIRKATPNRSMRITWTDAKTSLEVNFYGKGDARSQVVVQHSKLASSDDGERMKSYWKEALDRLKGVA